MVPAKNKKSRDNQPIAIHGVVENLIRSLGITRSYYGWSVVSNWAEIVGEKIALNSRAIRFEDGDLIVAVPKDSWRQELSMEKDTILAQIRSLPYGGSIKKIVFIKSEKGK